MDEEDAKFLAAINQPIILDEVPGSITPQAIKEALARLPQRLEMTHVLLTAQELAAWRALWHTDNDMPVQNYDQLTSNPFDAEYKRYEADIPTSSLCDPYYDGFVSYLTGHNSPYYDREHRQWGEGFAAAYYELHSHVMTTEERIYFCRRRDAADPRIHVRLRTLVDSYYARNGFMPSELHLSLMDEDLLRLDDFMHDVHGSNHLGSPAVTRRPQFAYYMGMLVIWDAPETRVTCRNQPDLAE